MATSAAPRGTELYHHRQLQCIECLGCLEVIEIPKFAVIRQGGTREAIRYNPENLLLWMEMQQLDHAACGSYSSVEEARQARMFRKERDRRKLIGQPRAERVQHGRHC